MKKYLKLLLTAIFATSTCSTISQTIPSSGDIACFFSWYEKSTFLQSYNSPSTQFVGKLIYRKYPNGAILGAVNNRIFMRDNANERIMDRGSLSSHISTALSVNCGIPAIVNEFIVSAPCAISNLSWIVNENKCQAPTSSILSGASISLNNTVIGKEGNAEFSCNNGAWILKSGASCTPVYVAGHSVDGDGDGGDGGGGAGDGVPIANAPITLIDAKGKIIQTTTDSQGNYRVNLKGLTPPYIVKVTRPDGTEWYSPSLGEPDATGFVRMNITGLTDKVANYVADSVGIEGGAAKVNPSILSVNPAALQAAKNKLNAGLTSPLTYAGINPSIFDPVRNNYVAAKGDKYDGMLDKLSISKNETKGNTVVVGTFAGINESFINGIGDVATFNNPYGVVVDSIGNVYVTDSTNHAIRKITPSGLVSTFAGNGASGFLDGTGYAARFNNPQGIAIDIFDNMYVADTDNNAVRKITIDGVVTTLAGSGTKGFFNGNGILATFNKPVGVAVNKSGDIYVTDTSNYAIRKITSDGIVSTLAGNGKRGYVNGASSEARFYYLNSIAVDSKDNVYIGDRDPSQSNNTVIRKITSNGEVTTFVMTKGEVKLYGVYSIAFDKNDNMYISDISSLNILTSNLFFSKITGDSDLISSNNYSDGLASNAIFSSIRGVAIDKKGNIIVADTGNNMIRKISSERIVTTLAGSPAGLNNSIGNFARFNSPVDIALDNNGNYYVIDKDNSVIRKITSTGFVSTFAGRLLPTDVIFDIDFDSKDGNNNLATFNSPIRITLDTNKNIYVLEYFKVRKITPNGNVTTLNLSNQDIYNFQGIVIDNSGYIYITALMDDVSSIYKITPNGLVTPFVDTKFGNLNGMAIDKNGNIYISDTGNHSIIKITPTGIINTVAGNGTKGLVDGIGSNAKFNSPTGIAVDEKGNIFVADTDNNAIRKITPEGFVTTIAGNGKSGYSNGMNNPLIITFNHPRGIAVDKNGHLFVADTGNNAIRVILP